MGTFSKYVAPLRAGFHLIHRGKAIWILQLAIVVFFYENQVSAIPISDLVATQGSIQQGDKLFTNFRFESFLVGVGDFSPQQTGAIDIQGITVSGENGLRFSGPFTATFPGDGASIASVTYHLGYDVFVTDSGFNATDFRQSFTATNSGVVSAHVTATVKNCTDIVCIGPGEFELFGADSGFTGAQPSSPTPISNNFDFPFGTNFLSVDLDIFLCALCSVFNPPLAASVAFPFFDEIYSQAAVPEPSAFLLLGTGLLAFSLMQFGRKTSVDDGRTGK
jgi:hypothetical protein